MNPIRWMVELEVKPGQKEALKTLVAEMVSDVQTNESGAEVWERAKARFHRNLRS